MQRFGWAGNSPGAVSPPWQREVSKTDTVSSILFIKVNVEWRKVS